MATTARTTRTTAVAFDDSDVPELAELVGGGVVESTTPPPIHGWTARNVFTALNDHVRARKLGEVFGDNVAKRGVPVHAAGEPARRVDGESTLDGGDLLPGLSPPVADVFAGVGPEPWTESEG